MIKQAIEAIFRMDQTIVVMSQKLNMQTKENKVKFKAQSKGNTLLIARRKIKKRKEANPKTISQYEKQHLRE